MTYRLIDSSPIHGGEEVICNIEIKEGAKTELREITIPSVKFFDIGAKIGEISVTQALALFYEADLNDIIKKGLSLLGYSMVSGNKLITKLIARGYDSDLSKEAVQIIMEKGYIDERSDAFRILEVCLKKLWGKKKICVCLFEKGYTEETAKEVISTIDEEEYMQNAVLAIKQKRIYDISSNKQNKEKIKRYLTSRGYTMSEISKAIQLFICQEEK